MSDRRWRRRRRADRGHRPRPGRLRRCARGSRGLPRRAENWSGAFTSAKTGPRRHPSAPPRRRGGPRLGAPTVERGLFATDGTGLLGMTCRDPEAFRHCYTVLRPIFDRHLGQVAVSSRRHSPHSNHGRKPDPRKWAGDRRLHESRPRLCGPRFPGRGGCGPPGGARGL